jgi:hypothetical protein
MAFVRYNMISGKGLSAESTVSQRMAEGIGDPLRILQQRYVDDDGKVI